MALTYLVDTSVLTRLANPKVRALVEPLALAGSVSRCSISSLEIGAQAKNERTWDELLGSLRIFETREMGEAELRRASQVQRLLAESGLRGRKVPSLLVAATAEAAGMTVLHYDRDFEVIARVTGQPHRWVVPNGSLG